MGISATAQHAGIRGVVRDPRDVLIVASVSLLNANDSSWIRTELSDDKGEYKFTNIVSGEYVISATSMGYKTCMQPVSVTDNGLKVIDIIMQAADASLAEVTVTGRKSFIEMGLGKITVNVDASASSMGTNVLELLRRSPGITVDQSGNISMQGKQGVQVLIDDRSTYLSGEQLADYLKGLSADDVAQLELVTRPSAKYEAAGNAGIINIKRKKNKKTGLNGSANVRVGQGVYPFGGGNLLVNYRRKKLNISFSSSEFLGKGFAYWNEHQQLTDPGKMQVVSTSDINSYAKEEFSIANFRLAADYDLSPKAVLGASVKGGYHTNSFLNKVYASSRDQQANLSTFTNTFSPGGFIRENLSANSYFTYKFNSARSLNLNVDYVLYANSPYQDISSAMFDTQMLPLPDPLVLQSHQPTRIDVYSVKADYTDTLRNGIKLEAGFKSSIVKTDNDALFRIFKNNYWLADTTRTNRFQYTENINAIYLSVDKSFGDKWEARAGLRAENTNAAGRQQVHNDRFTKSYVSLFPTAYLNYKANNDNQLELNYGRRIDRPPYDALNPFIFYSFQYNYSVGNRYLSPQFTHRTELKHSFKNMIVTSLGYSNTTGEITNVLDVNGNTGIVYSTQRNVASSKAVDISVNFNRDLFKWWSLNVSGGVYYAAYKGVVSTANIHRQGTGGSVNISSQFNIGKSWNAEVMAYYTSRSIQSIITDATPVVFISVAGAKKINDVSTIKVSFDDPFRLYNTGEQNHLANFVSSANFRYNSQVAILTYIYNFGRGQSKSRDINATDEAGRIKLN